MGGATSNRVTASEGGRRQGSAGGSRWRTAIAATLIAVLVGFAPMLASLTGYVITVRWYVEAVDHVLPASAVIAAAAAFAYRRLELLGFSLVIVVAACWGLIAHWSLISWLLLHPTIEFAGPLVHAGGSLALLPFALTLMYRRLSATRVAERVRQLEL